MVNHLFHALSESRLTNIIGRTTLPIMFAPLPPRLSAVDACADALRRRVLDGELAVGARLPPERELAASLGASRVTLR
ncbi:MAG TPA: GntR family transcriptional regulator, partial [Polyangia bacterium]